MQQLKLDCIENEKYLNERNKYLISRLEKYKKQEEELRQNNMTQGNQILEDFEEDEDIKLNNELDENYKKLEEIK